VPVIIDLQAGNKHQWTASKARRATEQRQQWRPFDNAGIVRSHEEGRPWSHRMTLAWPWFTAQGPSSSFVSDMKSILPSDIIDDAYAAEVCLERYGTDGGASSKS